MTKLTIRDIAPSDASVWEILRTALWPEGAADHRSEIAMFFAGTLTEPQAVLVAEDATGTIVGFAELAVRMDLPGLAGQRIGYVEGLYVRPEFRLQGVARILLRASQSWARNQECAKFASDRADRIIVSNRF